MELGPNGEFMESAKTTGIKFRNADTGQEMLVQVNDKYPQMGPVHVEGRRVIEVTVEWFIEFVNSVGWLPVNPETDKTAGEEND